MSFRLPSSSDQAASPAAWIGNGVWRRAAGCLAAPVLALALAGCGQSDEPRVPVFPVTGKVLVNDKDAPVGAQIVLHPQGHELPPGTAATAVIKKDGTFQVGTYASGDGVPAGEYVATIEWRRIIQTADGGVRGPNVLPKQYAKPDTSPIKVSVRDDVNNKLDPIRIVVR